MTTEQLWPPVAGKYGQTRNGRMVGPMRNASEGGFYCQETGWYQGNGKWAGGVEGCVFDLISEWIGDPAPVQPIDFSKVRAGDTLLVKVTFRDAGKTWFWAQYLGDDKPGQIGAGGKFAISDAVQHIPASRPIEVGCRVKHRGSGYKGFVRTDAVLGYVLVEIDGHTLPGSWNVEDLTRIDGEAA